MYKFLIRALYALFVRRKVCICRLADVLSPLITKILGPQIANETNYLSPQICAFAICGSYLRTAHLLWFVWNLYSLKKSGTVICMPSSSTFGILQIVLLT
jgi:hypothetical protein